MFPLVFYARTDSAGDGANESSSPTGRDGVKRNVFGVCNYCHSHEFKETLINMKYSFRSG